MEKSGFINMIHHDQQNQNSVAGSGEYTTSKSKCFDQFKDLLDEIQKQQNKIGKGINHNIFFCTLIPSIMI